VEQFLNKRVQIILPNPFNNRHAYRVSESKESLVGGNDNPIVVGAHQPRAFSRGQKSCEVFPVSCFEQYLTAASSSGGPQAPGYAVETEFRPGLAVSDAPEHCSVRPGGARDHEFRDFPMARTHLVEEIFRAFAAPPRRRLVR